MAHLYQCFRVGQGTPRWHESAEQKGRTPLAFTLGKYSIISAYHISLGKDPL